MFGKDYIDLRIRSKSIPFYKIYLGLFGKDYIDLRIRSKSILFYKIYLGLFGKDYIDLRIRSKLSSLKGPGKGLVGNKYIGDAIFKQSFETQFIFDLSSSLSINPYRIYIIFFLIDVERIRYLTVQIQLP